jgi:hypothetical protein
MRRKNVANALRDRIQIVINNQNKIWTYRCAYYAIANTFQPTEKKRKKEYPIFNNHY